MVLPGYALIADGTQVHVAAFPGYESTRQLVLCRAFASQAAAYVVLAGGIIDPDQVEDAELRDAISALPAMTGDSYIIDPMGEVVAGPAVGETMLLAEVSHARIREAKALCDTGRSLLAARRAAATDQPRPGGAHGRGHRVTRFTELVGCELPTPAGGDVANRSRLSWRRRSPT